MLNVGQSPVEHSLLLYHVTIRVNTVSRWQ